VTRVGDAGWTPVATATPTLGCRNASSGLPLGALMEGRKGGGMGSAGTRRR
jgi:hypothetical protein